MTDELVRVEAPPFEVALAQQDQTAEDLVIRFGPGGVAHLLIQGDTRSGKSWTAARIIGELAGNPQVAFIGFDFKFGLELSLWENRFSLFCDDIDDAPDAMGQVMRLMMNRGKFMKANKLRVWRIEDGPRVFVVWDELNEVAAKTDAAKESLRRLESVIRRCGALGIHVVASAQYALAQDFGSVTLNQFGARIAHRMKMDVQYATALAVDQRQLFEAGVKPIKAGLPGRFYVTGVPGVEDLTLAQTFPLDDAALEARAVETAGLRIPLEALVGVQ